MRQPGRNRLSEQISRAFAHLRKGRESAAQAIFEELMVEPTEDVETLVELGSLCSALGRAPQAVGIFSRAVSIEPDNAIYLGLLGSAMMSNNQWLEALEVLRAAVKADPDLPDPLVNLGAVHVHLGDYLQAIEVLEKAARMKPSAAAIYANITIALSQTGRYEEAVKYSDKALKLDPGNPNAHDTRGRLLRQLGRHEQATLSFEKAIQLKRTHGHAYEGLASSRKFTEKDGAFITKTENTLKESLAAEDRALIHFALGKIYDDCREWEKAFEHYRKGNLLKKMPVDAGPPARLLKQMKRVFTPALLQEAANLGSESEVPVFIVGMPRSGTTLIEQILASHPDAAGAGELMEIDQIAKRLCPAGDLSQIRRIFQHNLTTDTLRANADRYLKVLRTGREGAQRIADKMPENFFDLGLIQLLFPHARVIHAIRHPLDTCLSCYFQPFSEMAWAFDPESIAERYRLYREVMAYWKSVLPADKILEVEYERLIEDPETQARRIVEGCGLAWDPVCLDFYKSGRAVNTASVWQVRQPIYRSSARRWRNYASWLGEFADALSYYLKDDADELRQHGLKLRSRWRPKFL